MFYPGGILEIVLFISFNKYNLFIALFFNSFFHMSLHVKSDFYFIQAHSRAHGILELATSKKFQNFVWDAFFAEEPSFSHGTCITILPVASFFKVLKNFEKLVWVLNALKTDVYVCFQRISYKGGWGEHILLIRFVFCCFCLYGRVESLLKKKSDS